jgi:hypothetical protein
MPEWIHNRAEHLLAKNPDMSKSKAFAIATQQSHALGKSPKGYGTAQGKRVAKRKYDTPKDDVKKANPGALDSPKLAAMRDELLKQADRLFGGKADGKTDKDFDKQQLAMGEEVEQEHAKGDRTLAREIARDHLQEIPDYYTRLKKMEDAAPKRKEAGVWDRAADWYQPDRVSDAPGRAVDFLTTTPTGRSGLAGGLFGGLYARPGDRVGGALAGGVTSGVLSHLARQWAERTGSSSARLANALAQIGAPVVGGIAGAQYSRAKGALLGGLDKESMDPDDPYLLDQVGKSKLPKLSALPPNKSLVVKKAAATGVFGLPLERDPMAGTGQKNEAKKRLAQSQKIGVPDAPKMPKTKPLPIKVASLEKDALGYYGTRAAIGAGTGAALGAAAGALHGGRPDAQGQTHRLRGALLGGAGGAAVGGAAGYAAPMYLRGRAGSASVAPLSRGEAARSVVQQARSDTGQLMQRAGERLQMKGRATQGAVAKEQLTAAREAARPKTLQTHHVQPGQFSPGVPTELRQEIAEVPQWGHGAYGHQKAASVKHAWTESMYSGGTSIGAGSLNYASGIPAFVNPPVKTAGPPTEQGPQKKKAAITKLAAMADELMKLNAFTPTLARQASQARRVGLPGHSSKNLGPGTGAISKPVGFGSKSDVAGSDQAKLGSSAYPKVWA